MEKNTGIKDMYENTNQRNLAQFNPYQAVWTEGHNA